MSCENPITQQNIENVRKQILMKQSDTPFFGTINNVAEEVTDFDHFPYTRFYRGAYNSADPISLEREAGFRPIMNGCYTSKQCSSHNITPNHCFEAACSVTYPCHPKTLTRFADREALLVQLNDRCVVQYR